jgi:hypothetical protein
MKRPGRLTAATTLRKQPTAAKPPVGTIILLVLSLAPAAFQLYYWSRFLPGYTDFKLYYLYASMGLHHGWNTLYNLAIEHQEWVALGRMPWLPEYPMIYLPPLAWLVAPFALLPLPVGYAIWATLILGLFLWIWTVTAPGTRLQRWILLALAIGIYPVAFGLMLAQALIVVMAAAIGAWYLLRRQRQVAAGMVLILIVIKPQVAFVVPFALLAAGYWKTFGVWAAGTALVLALAVISLGPDGVQAYQARLHGASTGAPEYLVMVPMTVPGLLGRGWAGLAGQGLMAALALWAAYRRRRDGLEFPVIAGLLGSLLVTPYIHPQDLLVLIVAGWLYLRVDRPRLSGPFLVAGYVLIGYLLPATFLGLINPALIQLVEPLVLVGEVLWLSLMLWPVPRPATTRPLLLPEAAA